jgi:hypothetical protein
MAATMRFPFSSEEFVIILTHKLPLRLTIAPFDPKKPYPPSSPDQSVPFSLRADTGALFLLRKGESQMLTFSVRPAATALSWPLKDTTGCSFKQDETRTAGNSAHVVSGQAPISIK